MSRRNNRKKDAKNKKAGKWNFLDGLLIVASIGLGLGGLICMGASSDNKGALIGLAIFLSGSLLLVPEAIMVIRRDCKERKYSHTANSLIMSKALTKITDVEPYRKKLIWGVLREGFFNSAAFIAIYTYAIVSNFLASEHALMSRDRGKGAFFMVILAFLFFPLFTYSGGFTLVRLIRAIKGDYILCRGHIYLADGFEHKLIVSYDKRKTSFDYCRGIGVKASDLIGKEAVIAFFHDEIFVMEEVVV